MTAGAQPSLESPRRIGIAVVIHAGRVLVGIRGPDGPLPGMAEFPGGKCEAGEPPESCAVRECVEETGLDVVAMSKLHDVVWDYPYGSVHLHFIACRPRRTEQVGDRQQGFRWVGPAELPNLDFPEANRPVIRELVRRLGNPDAVVR